MTIKSLGQLLLGTDNSVVYTSPADKKTVVTDMQLCNVTSTDATVTVWMDADGTNAGDTEAVLKTFTVPANDFAHWSGRLVLESGGNMAAKSGTANAIALVISGAEV